jgi:hypothetical protein
MKLFISAEGGTTGAAAGGIGGDMVATGAGGMADAVAACAFGTVTTAVQFGQRACPPAAEVAIRSSFWHCGQRNSIKFAGTAEAGGKTESVMGCGVLASVARCKFKFALYSCG